MLQLIKNKQLRWGGQIFQVTISKPVHASIPCEMLHWHVALHPGMEGETVESHLTEKKFFLSLEHLYPAPQDLIKPLTTNTVK